MHCTARHCTAPHHIVSRIASVVSCMSGSSSSAQIQLCLAAAVQLAHKVTIQQRVVCRHNVTCDIAQTGYFGLSYSVMPAVTWLVKVLLCCCIQSQNATFGAVVYLQCV